MSAVSTFEGDGGRKIVAVVRGNHYTGRAIVLVHAPIADVVVVGNVAPDAERIRQPVS